MSAMKCPDCGCNRFYVKDPDDQYNINEFELQEEEIVYLDDDDEQIEITADTETFCDKCAWHDKFRILKK